jgi:arginase
MQIPREMAHDTLSLYEQKPLDKPLTIISIPTDLGSDARGCAETPEYLYKHGLERMLASIGVEVNEKIGIPCPTLPVSIGLLKNIEEIAEVSRTTALETTKALKNNNIVLALGGDHSSAIGSIAGAANAYPSLGVIYIDAHPDVNTPETTLTGNVHGMNAAALTGFGHDSLTSLARPIAPEHFLHIGVKDFDQAEIDFLREHNKPVTMFDIATHGLGVALKAVDALLAKVSHVWVSMDIDSIDKAFAPAVAMPTECGFTKREILALAQYIGHRAPLVGLDIAEMLPAHDVENKTANLAIELIARFLGGEYSWYRDYADNYEKINSVVEVREKRT